MLTLGERLEAAIKASGKTAVRIAKEIGTSEANISKIVNGQNANPKYQLLIKLAKATKTTLGALNGESIQLSADDETALTSFRAWIDGKLPMIDALTEPNAEVIPAPAIVDRAMRIADRNQRGPQSAVSPFPDADLTLLAIGDSMIGAGIRSGDTLFATTTRRRAMEWALGKIIAFQFGDDVFVKRVTSRRRRHHLLSANPRYSVIEIDPEDGAFKILGVVIGRLGPVV